jgi:hypothetical protein
MCSSGSVECLSVETVARDCNRHISHWIYNRYLAQAVTPLTYFREVSHSNIGQNIDCSDWGFSWFSLVPPTKFRDRYHKPGNDCYVTQNFPFIVHYEVSRDSAVARGTDYELNGRGVGVRVQVRARYFPSSHPPGRFWGPPSLLSN